MNALGQRIAALIAAQGPMSIAEFMTIALHDREAGYYATRDPLGVAGDFITAPEISQMFGELIGLWLAQVWQDQGRPKNPRLVELGPGRGTLLADALRALKLVPEFLRALDVVLVEVSPVLRTLQEKSLSNCGVPVRWVPEFRTIAHDRPFYLIANEFFDALPIQQYVKTERGWCERMVSVDRSGELAFALSPPLPEWSLPIAQNRAGAPNGSVYEFSKAGVSLAEDIGHFVEDVGGAAIIIDYGYDVPGFSETLQAVASHKFADVLSAPGSSDLSAHVDFSALRIAARQGGAAVYGPIGQGEFLTALGIAQRAERLSRADPQKIAAEVNRLTNVDQMGTLFKALAIVPKFAPTPPGFG